MASTRGRAATRWLSGLLAVAAYAFLLARWLHDPGIPTSDGFLLRSRVYWPWLLLVAGLAAAWVVSLGDRPRRMAGELARAFALERRDIWLLVGLLALALGYQAVLFTHPTGAFDADAVLPGIIAKHIADGRPAPAFVYRMQYGGTLSAHLLSLAYVLIGPSVVGLLLVTRGFYLLFIVWEFVMVRALAGRTAAASVALLLALPPPALLGHLQYVEFPETLAFGAMAVAILSARTAQRLTDDLWYAIAGLVIGLGFWTQPLILPIAGAACVTVLIRARFRAALRAATTIAAGLFIGCLPALIGWGAEIGHFAAWLVGGGDQRVVTVAESIRRLVYRGMLIAFGPNHRLQPLPLLGSLFVAVILAATTWSLVCAWREHHSRAGDAAALRAALLASLALGVLLHAVSFVVSPFNYLVAPPRYLIAFWIAIPALLAFAVVSVAPQRRAPVAFVFCLWALAGIPESRGWMTDAAVTHTAQMQSLGAIEAAGVRYCEAPYWDAYRVTFYSFERVLCASNGVQRDPYYRDIVAGHLVAGASRPHVLARPDDRWLEDALDEARLDGAPHRIVRTPAFIVLVFEPRTVDRALPSAAPRDAAGR